MWKNMPLPPKWYLRVHFDQYVICIGMFVTFNKWMGYLLTNDYWEIYFLCFEWFLFKIMRDFLTYSYLLSFLKSAYLGLFVMAKHSAS